MASGVLGSCEKSLNIGPPCNVFVPEVRALVDKLRHKVYAVNVSSSREPRQLVFLSLYTI